MDMFVPSQRAVTQGHYKKIDGIWHKRCSGPAHDEPTYLPATPKYFYLRKVSRKKYGYFVSSCRLCHNLNAITSGGTFGMVDAVEVRHFYEEAANRIGLLELARRTGLTYEGLALVINGKSRQVRKSNFRKVLLVLLDVRRSGEASINMRARQLAISRASGGSDVCGGCGTVKSNYTHGCDICYSRKKKKQRREK